MKVALLQSSAMDYPNKPPFHPPLPYPELTEMGFSETETENSVYGTVRDALALLGLDRPNFGTPYWNPLSPYVRSGAKVVIKPNFVLHEFGPQKGANCLTTNGSLIRAILDYVYLAAGRESKLVIADAPIQGTDFERILEQSGIPQIQEYYWRKLHHEIQVVDLRQVRAEIDESSGLITKVHDLAGDPRGYRIIDLGKESRLSQLDAPQNRYVVGDYDMTVTNRRHGNGRHEYVVSNTILEANAFVSLPKLKTHNKVGVTACLKNLIGIIGSKDCLPHHRHGRTTAGGDEFPDDYPLVWLASNRVRAALQGRVSTPVWRALRSSAEYLFGIGSQGPKSTTPDQKPFFPSGSWWGNDTIWRTVDDLNRILFFYDRNQDRLAEKSERAFFALVDGIIAMEGNGPLKGGPRRCGVLLAGDDPVAVDVVAATLMGFEWRRIPMLKGIAHANDSLRYSAFAGNETQISILTNEQRWQSLGAIRRAHLDFLPPAGWQQQLRR